MLKVLTALNNLLGALIGLAVVGLLSAGGWFVFQNYYAERWKAQEAERTLAAREAEIDALRADLLDRSRALDEAEQTIGAQAAQIGLLEEDVAAKAIQIEQLETAVALLKVDHRVAQVSVVSQQGSAAEGDLTTTFSFVELSERGEPIDRPRVFTIEGDVVYIDAWVIKFDDEHVELADPLRATSVCLFRRVFGERQQPSEGFPLDAVGSRPAPYRSGKPMSELEREIWEQFWEYANDPGRARDAGVRAAHGEAPSIKLLPNLRYRVLLRSSGGLSIVPEAAPPGEGAPL